MSTQHFYPEMGEAKPQNVSGEISHSHYGKHYFVKTPMELKGRGIVFIDTYNENNCNNPAKFGWNNYKVTNRAMEILEAKYEFSMELLLD